MENQRRVSSQRLTFSAPSGKNVFACHMSWGHDACCVAIFYACHQQDAYQHLLSEHDQKMLPWVQKFNRYDLYSKGAAKPDLKQLKPYYDELIAEFFPERIDW